jgi:hypothetical protein
MDVLHILRPDKALTFNPDEYMYAQVKTEIILTPARLLSCHFLGQLAGWVLSSGGYAIM